MNPEDLDRLRLGAFKWNKWRTENPDATIDLSNADLEGFVFDGFSLQRVSLRNAKLCKASFKTADLEHAFLCNANLSNCIMEKTSLFGSDLTNANLEAANLRSARLTGADFSEANCTRASFVYAEIQEARFDKARCYFTDFSNARAYGAIFENSDLRYAVFDGAELTGAKFIKAIMGPTSLKRISFLDDHLPLHDFTETIRCDHWLTWGKLRLIGSLPLFSTSYTTIGFSLAYINCVEAINRSKAISFLNYPIGVPHRISLILFASIMLAIGATLYAIFCPKRVREFAETQWVEEFGHSRLQYFSDSWSRQHLLWATFVFTVLGGVVSVLLFVEFLCYAIRYLMFPIG